MSEIIRLENICFSYPQSKRLILNKCSLTIKAGELVTILGPNGSGKSTLLNCSCNLLNPQSGNILLNGKNISKMEQKEIAQVIGYVQQTQQSAFAYSVFNYVLMGRASTIGLFQNPTEKDNQKVWEVLTQMGITHLADFAITELSGGERQLAAIARAIVQNPQVLFFDEPTAHLDYGNQINTLQLISDLQKKGFAIVMTTHNPDHSILLGGKVAILSKDGQLEVGNNDEILTEKRLKQIYNTDLRLPYVKEVDRIVCIPNGIK